MGHEPAATLVFVKISLKAYKNLVVSVLILDLSLTLKCRKDFAQLLIAGRLKRNGEGINMRPNHGNEPDFSQLFSARTKKRGTA